MLGLSLWMEAHGYHLPSPSEMSRSASLSQRAASTHISCLAVISGALVFVAATQGLLLIAWLQRPGGLVSLGPMGL